MANNDPEHEFDEVEAQPLLEHEVRSQISEAIEKRTGEAVSPEILDAIIDMGLAAPDSSTITTLYAKWAGPLPPPDSLRAFEDALEGLSREIVDQWKSETALRHERVRHKMELERKREESDRRMK